MFNSLLTRRELTRRALAGVFLLPAFSSAAFAQSPNIDPLPVDPLPVVPPSAPVSPAPAEPDTEGRLLIRLVPLSAGYALTETQKREVAAKLQDYPGGFAKARTYKVPSQTGPAFAADAPPRRKGRSK